MSTQLNFFDLAKEEVKEEKKEKPKETHSLFPRPILDYVNSKGYKTEFGDDGDNWFTCEIHLNNGIVMGLIRVFKDDDVICVELHDKDRHVVDFDYGSFDRITDEDAFKFLKVLETKKLGDPLYILREPPREETEIR